MANIVKCYFSRLSQSNLDEQVRVVDRSQSAFALRLKRKRNRRLRGQSILGRLLLSCATGISFEEIISDEVVGLAEFGKPEFVDSSRGFFSISHSGDLVVVAVSAFPIGVDVEVECSRAGGIPYGALCDHEKALVRHLNYSAFLELWVRKESALKLMGAGLSIPPDTLDCSSNPIRFCGRSDRWHKALPIFTESLALPFSYIAAFASYSSDVRIQYQQV